MVGKRLENVLKSMSVILRFFSIPIHAIITWVIEQMESNRFQSGDEKSLSNAIKVVDIRIKISRIEWFTGESVPCFFLIEYTRVHIWDWRECGNNKIKFVTLNEDRPRKVFYEKKKKGKNFLPGVD